jgi:F-type H+-transporting ATPase subunit b
MHQLLTLCAAAAAKDPPLIDLDSTVFLQLGVFLITAVVLSKFLFKPFLAVRAQREAGIEGARAEALRLDEESRVRLSDYESALGKAKVAAQDERKTIRQRAQAEEQAIHEAARTSTSAVIESARATLERDAAQAKAELEARTQEIARTIAKKILGREVA